MMRGFYIFVFLMVSLQDIIKRIMSFTENGSRGISVLSANGAVANVKIQLHSSSRRVVTYKVYLYDKLGLAVQSYNLMVHVGRMHYKFGL